MNYKPDIDSDIYDLENSFYLRSQPFRITKLLGQYELYKMILDLPGSVVECGVFKGVSLVRFATFRHCFETPESRKLIAFDAFGAFPNEDLIREDDIKFAQAHGLEDGGQGISKEDLEKLLIEKKFENIELIKGNVTDTIPAYFEENQHERISLLHLDMDIYLPTKFAIEYLYDNLVKGGIVMIDDYATVSGATAAIDEFIYSKGISLRKAPYYKVPSYFIKN